MDWIIWVVVGGILTVAWLWLSHRMTAKGTLKRGEIEQRGNLDTDDVEWHLDRAHTRRPPV